MDLGRLKGGHILSLAKDLENPYDKAWPNVSASSTDYIEICNGVPGRGSGLCRYSTALC